jgi:hypothetical protein
MDVAEKEPADEMRKESFLRDFVVEWFEKYVTDFSEESGHLCMHMELKRQHSFKVAENACRIASLLCWSREDTEIAFASGLLHDTGRFRQFQDYGTFFDPASVDHGEEGYLELKRFFPSRLLDGTTEKILMETARYHNKKDMVSTDRAVTPFLKIVRDADKLDILEVVRANVESGRMGELMPQMDLEGGISPALVEEIDREGSASYSNVRSLADFLFLQVSWVYELNYEPSVVIFKERDTSEWFLSKLESYDILCPSLRKIKVFLDNFS